MKFSVLHFVVFAILASISIVSFGSEAPRMISGKVTCEGDPVPFVAVYFDGTSSGTITDEKGAFLIAEIPADNTSLKVKGLGYKTAIINLEANHGQTEFFIAIEPDVRLLQQVVVSGSRVGVLRYLPGSVGLISASELAANQPISSNEVLRNIPGVHVVEEEGAGLRANIGVRGLDPDKSRNVLILEDGIPVALAPYGEPEMYFTPNIDRMHSLEVLKGNGSILFGLKPLGVSSTTSQQILLSNLPEVSLLKAVTGVISTAALIMGIPRIVPVIG